MGAHGNPSFHGDLIARAMNLASFIAFRLGNEYFVSLIFDLHPEDIKGVILCGFGKFFQHGSVWHCFSSCLYGKLICVFRGLQGEQTVIINPSPLIIPDFSVFANAHYMKYILFVFVCFT